MPTAVAAISGRTRRAVNKWPQIAQAITMVVETFLSWCATAKANASRLSVTEVATEPEHGYRISVRCLPIRKRTTDIGAYVVRLAPL